MSIQKLLIGNLMAQNSNQIWFHNRQTTLNLFYKKVEKQKYLARAEEQIKSIQLQPVQSKRRVGRPRKIKIAPFEVNCKQI